MTASLYQDLLACLPEATLIVSYDGRIVEANASAASLLGRPSASLRGQPLAGLVDESAEKVLGYLERCGRTGSLLPGQLAFHRPGSSPLPLRIDGAAITGSNGGPPQGILLRLRPRAAGVEGFHRLNEQLDALKREVEGRLATDLALRESEERRQMALHATGVGTWLWDPEADVVTGDPHVFQLFGVEGQRPIDRLGQLLGRVDAAYRPVLEETLERARADAAMHFISFRINREDGSPRWLSTQVKTFRTREAGARLAAVTMDITDQKASEEEQQEIRRLESVGRLAGGVAHEANNQMTVVLGCADFILRRKDLPPVVREDVEQLRRAAERTSGITTQLLAFSRRQVLRTSEVDLNAVVSNMLTALERALEHKGSLHVHLGQRLKPVLADPDQLEQVLLNLVFNARDAIAEGGHVLIATQDVTIGDPYLPPGSREVVAPGEYAMVAVSDNGAGMDRATMERVFEPFFTTKDVGKGTGLGLAMVHGSIKQSNGYVWVDSVPLDGTTFRILLPAADRPAPAPAPPKPRHEERPRPARSVLVVDDDEGVRSVIARALDSAGYRVTEASDGDSALDLLRTGGPFDLVVTDLIMPGMRGEELGARIREQHLAPRVIYVSGLHDRVQLDDTGDRHVQVLKKPMTPDQLLRAVEDALGRLV